MRSAAAAAAPASSSSNDAVGRAVAAPVRAAALP
jgi:hypothetical protein